MFINLCFQETVKPPNWQKEIYELDPENSDNNGFLNTDFIVWMRTAALPNFRKLYRILVRYKHPLYKNGLPAGTYNLVIQNSELFCIQKILPIEAGNYCNIYENDTFHFKHKYGCEVNTIKQRTNKFCSTLSFLFYNNFIIRVSESRQCVSTMSVSHGYAWKIDSLNIFRILLLYLST